MENFKWPILLGSDFLSKHSATVDYKNMTLAMEINEEYVHVPLEQFNKEKRCIELEENDIISTAVEIEEMPIKIICMQDVMIPPLTEQRVKVTTNRKIERGKYVIEPVEKLYKTKNIKICATYVEWNKQHPSS